MRIDLHMHSTASDGKLTPIELIDWAIKGKMNAIAITDHGSVEGIEEAIRYSKDKEIEFVPGIEFSANPGDLAKEIHIVGLFIDYRNKELTNLITQQKKFNVLTKKKIIKKLNELGYEITFEEVSNESKKESFGRPTIAQVLMKKYSQFKDRKQVFNELLGKEGKAFFKDESTPMKEIIKVIHASGGIAILAHPAYLYDNAELVIKEFIKIGGDGLEVEDSYANFGEEAQKLKDKFEKIAKENNLLISGGTDFHETKNNSSIGNFGLTEAEFKKIKDYVMKKLTKVRLIFI